VTTHHCIPNREAEFEKALYAAAPDAVVFDRFMAEEAFSFRVRQARPQAARILDMQDMHSLRRARQAVVEGGGGVAEALATIPDSASSKDLARELASVHRSDLSLVCSSTELNLLRGEFGVAPSKLALATFFCDPMSQERTAALPTFSDRSGFVTIGNFRHAPNLDSVAWLCGEVWPLVRASLPEATLTIFGAFPDHVPGTPHNRGATGGAKQRFHDPSQRVFVGGRAESVSSALIPARVLLAPLRFGAGIKGKIVDAWQHGLPVVTTPIGAEGMFHDDSHASSTTVTSADQKESPRWGGSWSSVSAAEVAAAAVHLHETSSVWSEAQQAGYDLVDNLFSSSAGLGSLRTRLEGCLRDLPQARQRDYVGAILWHHTARSTEYFSRWVELKEANKAAADLLK
jgi:hypothetical protein